MFGDCDVSRLLDHLRLPLSTTNRRRPNSHVNVSVGFPRMESIVRRHLQEVCCHPVVRAEGGYVEAVFDSARPVASSSVQKIPQAGRRLVIPAG